MDLEDFELYYYLAPHPDQAKKNIFFAHANAVPALTYKTLFERVSQELNVNIITYDMRGMGKTKLKETIHKNIWNWQSLVDDHIFIFEQLKLKMKGPWVLAGHSLGAWLSLLTSEKLHVKTVWLFDPPILVPNIIVKWIALILLKKRHLSPNSRKVRKRRTSYPSYDSAYKQMKKSAFMKNWDHQCIRDYLEGSFEQKGENIQLRHNPEWEAYLFEAYPAMAALGFLKLSLSFRRKFEPIFIVGKNSNTCNPKSKRWVKVFFPKLKWITLLNGSHMFPFEMPNETFKQFSKLISISK